MAPKADPSKPKRGPGRPRKTTANVVQKADPAADLQALLSGKPLTTGSAPLLGEIPEGKTAGERKALMEELFLLTVRLMIARARTGEVTAADLNAMRQFLSDNRIDLDSLGRCMMGGVGPASIANLVIYPEDEATIRARWDEVANAAFAEPPVTLD